MIAPLLFVWSAMLLFSIAVSFDDKSFDMIVYLHKMRTTGSNRIIGCLPGLNSDTIF